MANIIPATADSIREKIVNKIRQDFVKLIPDEQWDTLVKAELDRFTEATKNTYDGRALSSPLNLMIREAFEEMFKEKIKTELSSAEWSTNFYENGQLKASELVKKLIKENADVLMQGLMQSFTQQIVNDISNKLNSGGY